jgi:hypothetical protein
VAAAHRSGGVPGRGRRSVSATAARIQPAARPPARLLRDDTSKRESPHGLARSRPSGAAHSCRADAVRACRRRTSACCRRNSTGARRRIAGDRRGSTHGVARTPSASPRLTCARWIAICRRADSAARSAVDRLSCRFCRASATRAMGVAAISFVQRAPRRGRSAASNVRTAARKTNIVSATIMRRCSIICAWTFAKAADTF